MIAKHIYCNACGKKGHRVYNSARFARVFAERDGWTRYQAIDICETCTASLVDQVGLEPAQVTVDSEP